MGTDAITPTFEHPCRHKGIAENALQNDKETQGKQNVNRPS